MLQKEPQGILLSFLLIVQKFRIFCQFYEIYSFKYKKVLIPLHKWKYSGQWDF